MPKLRMVLSGAALALLAAGCGSDPYYSDPYYASSSHSYYPYYRDRLVYERHVERVHGRVTAIEVMRSDGWTTRSGDLYRVVVRDPQGAYQTYVMESLGSLRVGDLVRVDSGRIYPVG